jgi:Lrp/AsnC family transcriptional regulator, regulator for asnA, asnC and gidA
MLTAHIVKETRMGDHAANEIGLDELDLRIIAQLQDDGRKPSTEVARALGVPRTTVARRIERLVNQRIITVGVFANGPRIGLPIHVMIQIRVVPCKQEAVTAAIIALDEVRWVGVASGAYDLLIEGMLRSHAHLRHFLLEKLAKIEGITSMQTAHILSVAKITFEWERMLAANGVPDAAPGDPSPAEIGDAIVAGDGRNRGN